jgi:hypothetical protein
MSSSTDEEVIPPTYRRFCQKVTVAVVNFHTEWGNKEANFKKMENYINKAAGKKLI